jgi:SAM-dependent methyltransferase
MFEDVLDYAGARTEPAVEVGAGTGKASVWFARRLDELVCVEPDPRMAEILAERCRPYPGVRVEIARFEDWSPPRRFGLLIAGQAWHWVDRAVRWDRALTALAPGGTLALFWNYFTVRDPGLRARLGRINAAHGLSDLDQHTVAELPPEPDHDPEAWPWFELRDDDRFTAKRCLRYHGARRYTADRYLALLRSFSTFRLAPVERAEPLLEETAAEIARHGGPVELSTVTDLLLARTPDRPGATA